MKQTINYEVINSHLHTLICPVCGSKSLGIVLTHSALVGEMGCSHIEMEELIHEEMKRLKIDQINH